MLDWIKSALAHVAKFARDYYNTYSTEGKFWLTLGLAALVVDAAISFEYGISQTTWHGLGFALVAIFFALVPDKAYSEFEHKRFLSGIGLALLCVPLGIVAFYSHLGYGAGVRVGSIQQTNVQNTKFDDVRASLESDRTNIAMWREHLAKLQAENAWVTTVTPDGLKAQVANMEGDRIYKRSKECANVTIKESREFCDKLAALRERVALAAQANDLTARIEATQRLIDGKTQTASVTEYKSDSVTNQTNVAAQIWLAFTGAKPEEAIKPDTVVASFVNLFIAGGGSLAFMIMAPIGFFIAGRYRLPQPKAMTQVRADIEEVFDTIKDTGRDLVATVADKGREIIRETVKIDDGLRASIQRRLDEINARPRRRLA